MMLTSCLALACVATCLGQGMIPPRPRPPTPPEPQSTPPPPDATYWIMCSNKVRRGHDFVCTARILKGTSPVSVKVTLRSNDGEFVILESAATAVLPGDFQEIRMPIPINIQKPSDSPWSSSYNVTIEGRGAEVNFRTSKYLSLSDESMAIFVQTDKGIYKFGQTVKFRILMTTIDLKPMLNTPADIVIEDPNENRIWQRLGASSLTNTGVIDQFSLQIPSRAPTGIWKIKVSANGMEESVRFEVDNYVLPRFEVEIILPSFGLAYDPLLNVTVKAMYTFGKPVTDGSISVQLSKQYSYNRGHPLIHIGKLNSEGEFKIQYTRNQLLSYLNTTLWYRPERLSLNNYRFIVTANVTEENTKRTQRGEGTIQFYDTPLKMDFMDISPSNFKAGLPYTGFVEFKRQDDTSFSPEELSQVSVFVNVTYEVIMPTTTTTTTTTTPGPMSNTDLPRPDIVFEIERPWWGNYQPTETRILFLSNPVRNVPASGWIPITFDIPEGAQSVNIQIEGREPFTTVKTNKYLSQSRSPTNSFLQLHVPASASNPKVGDNLVIGAKSTSPVTELFYQVYAKGLLVLTNSLKPASPSTDLQFSVTLDQMMAPSVRIIAFYRREDNDEFVVDALTLSVEGIFQKPVSVSFSKNEVKPGEYVDVIIQAAESSVVFLASNDKSVNLLKKGNDITQDLVKEFMFTLDYGNRFPYWRSMMICGGPYYYGGNDASSAFSAANVLVFTDGLVYRHMERPMYGGGMAYDGMPSVMMTAQAGPPTGGAFSPAEVVRKFFPENWLWGSYLSNSSGQVVIPKKAPDTITSWVTTVFSMHPTFGLSIGNEPAELITSRDMFVTLDLPLGITQGEDYCFTASVFNYYSEPLEVLLTLNKSSLYNSIQIRSQIGSKNVDVLKRSSYVSKHLGHIPKDSIESTTFCINPIAVGRVPILIQALTRVPGLSDAVERVIKVKPEGVPRTTSMPFLVDLSAGTWVQNIPINFPTDVVPGSQHISFSATGSFLGPVLDNLDDLLRMPYGCGEQNMVNFAPTVFLTDYYFKTGSIDEQKLEKAKKYMMAGYTKELTYEHQKTGSYSAFGCKDDCMKKNGSLWLTAFVTKTFAQGEQLNSYQEVFALDHNVLERSMSWMTDQMKFNGEFVEYGKVFNTRMQGGSSKGEALTAYTLIALHEAAKVFNSTSKPSINANNAIQRGRTYLESQLNQINDAYDACIVGYALHLTGSEAKNRAFSRAEMLATSGDGLKYWKRPSETPKPRYSWSRTQDAINIEATAYCLLMYKERNINIDDSLPVLRWLTNQRGPQGGFISTQDTVIGLQALTSISAHLFSTTNTPLTVTLDYVDGSSQFKEHRIQINKDSEMLLQKIDVPYMNQGPSSVRIQASSDINFRGPTPAMVEVVLDYNVVSPTTTPKYDSIHKLTFNKNGFKLKIDMSVRGVASMTTLRVEIPAGFTPDMELLDMDQTISRTEIKEDDLVIYYDTGSIRNRWNVEIVMDGPVSGSLVFAKDKSYTISNYYEPSEEVTKLYSVNQNKSFCEMAKTFSVCPYI